MIRQSASSLILLFGALVCAGATTQKGLVLQPQDLLSMVQLADYPSTPTVISPDGRRVAYVIADAAGAKESTNFDPRGVGHKELWVIDVATTRAQRIGEHSADNWAPVWSPDGRRLAFYSGHGARASLVVWNASANVVTRTNATVGTRWGAHVVEWLPDGRHLIVPTLTAESVRQTAHAVDGVVKPTPTPAIAVFSSTPQPPTAAKRGDVIAAGAFDGLPTVNETLFDVASGSSRILVPGARAVDAPQLAPDRQSLIYLIDKGEVNGDINDREVFDVAIVQLRDGASRIVAKDVLTAYNGGTFSWSHDGRWIAFIGGWIPGDMASTTADSGSSFPGHCYLIDVRDSGHLRQLGDGLFSRFNGRVHWSQDDSTVYALDEQFKVLSAISTTTGAAVPIVTLNDAQFSPANQLVYSAGTHQFAVAISDSGERRIYDIDLLGKTANIAFRAYQSVSSLTFSADGQRTAFVGEDPRRPQDVWIAQGGFATTRQLTHLNPSIETYALGDAENINWRSKSGAPLYGALLLPAGYQAGKRYPTIVWVYGGEPEGSLGRTCFGFDCSAQAPYFNLQLLASRGYAVFVPNSILRVGTPMSDLADSVLPGIDEVVAMGVADPDRLGLYGQSYGGYSTMALLVQSDRFKAAVAMAGVYDIVAMYGSMYDDGTDWTSWAESEQGRMGGTPWQYPTRYFENSPFSYLDRVKTPVLLEYGTRDRFAAINAEEAFVGMRRLGRTTDLVRYADEGHVLVKRSNQIDLCDRIFAWFNRYLLQR